MGPSVQTAGGITKNGSTVMFGSGETAHGSSAPAVLSNAGNPIT